MRNIDANLDIDVKVALIREVVLEAANNSDEAVFMVEVLRESFHKPLKPTRRPWLGSPKTAA